MFGWELPPHNSGGLGVACFGIARALVRHGVNLTFVLPFHLPLPEMPFKVIFANVSTTPTTDLQSSVYSTTSLVHGHRVHISPYFSNLLAQVFAYAKNAKLIARKNTFDIIHVHDWLTIPAGLAAAEVSVKPLVIHVHATEFDRSGGGSANPVVFDIEKTGFAKASLIIAISHYVKNTIIKNYGIPPEKIYVVHNGIDPEDFPEPENKFSFLRNLKAQGNKIVLYNGRITIQKGVDHLLQAARIVLQYFPAVYFVISGSGDMEGQIVEQAAAMGIANHVLFTGFTRGQELIELYRLADLFVMPSVSEPFGLVPLESIVNGTPVLISKQSGVSEVLSHALKVDFWDQDEMANQIISCLRYPVLPQTLKQESGFEVKHLSWSTAADKLINIYDQL